MVQRKFLTSLILIVFLNLLVKPFWILGIDAEVQNRVGEAVYGNYFSLLNFSLLLSILLDMGTNNFNTRNIAQHPHLLSKHFFKILSLRLSLFLLYGSFTLLSGLFVGYEQHEFYLLGILILNQFLISITQFARSNFAGLHLFKTDAIVSVLDKTLLILFCSVLLWGNLTKQSFQIEWFIYAQTVAYGLSALISLVLLNNKVGRVKLSIKKDFSAAILKKSFPFSLFIFLMWMYTRVDVVMVERLMDEGDQKAGVYAQGYRMLDAVNQFALLFTTLMLPIFARLIKERTGINEMLSLGARIILTMSITVGVVGFGFREQILDLRYLDVSTEAVSTFGLLILSFIPISITHVFGTLLTANGSMKQLNRLGIATVGLNIILNFILIDQIGVKGAALATIITQSFMALAQIFLVRTIFNKPLKWGLLARFTLFSILMIVAVYAWNISEIDLPHLMSVLSLMLLGVLLAFVTGLLKVSDFMVLGKNASRS